MILADQDEYREKASELVKKEEKMQPEGSVEEIKPIRKELKKYSTK